MRKRFHVSQSRDDVPAELRAIRQGDWRQPTAGLAPAYVQANLVILPAAEADGFLRFCHQNPKPCPVLAISEPGNPHIPSLGRDLDLRTDVPRYRVFRNGEAIAEPDGIADLWRDDPERFRPDCADRGRGDLPVGQGAPTSHSGAQLVPAKAGSEEAQRHTAGKASGIGGTVRPKAL